MLEMPAKLLRVPKMTGVRIALALGVAVCADGLQFFLGLLFGPGEWVFVDPVIDSIAAVLTSWLVGFHILLLPTFVVKLVPLVEELPTWTACVGAVIVLRKRAESAQKSKDGVQTIAPPRQDGDGRSV